MPGHLTPEIEQVMSRGLDTFIRETVIEHQGYDYWIQNRYCIIARLMRAGRLQISSYKAQQKLVNNHAERRRLKRVRITEERAGILAGLGMLEAPPPVRMGHRHKRRKMRKRARQRLSGQI